MLLAGSLAGAGEIGFAAKPSAANDGAAAKIAFAVSAPTDVEVAVLDAKGAVVRHLVAGLLGKNAPEPLKKDSLAQEVAWDGKDDAGKPAAGGPFKARVRLGIGAKLDRFIQGPGSELEGPGALGVGPTGEVYVLAAGSMWIPPRMFVLDRSGKYLRTILPPPANLKREQLKGLEPIKLADGSEVPVVYNGHSASLMPFMAGLGIRQQLFVTAQGWIVFSSGGRTNEDQVPRRHVLVIKPDGSTPPEVGFVGPSIGGGQPQTQVAVSPDGKTVYVIGVISGKTAGHAVCRMGWDAKGAPEPFIGKLESPGSGADGLKDPQGLTVDAKGNICVADAGNNRVAVFDEKGKFLGETKVANPGQLSVHPKSGALYVTSSPQPLTGKHEPARPHSVVKFDKAVDGKEVARHDFSNYRYAPLMALDASAEPARVWLSYAPSYGAGAPLVPLTDEGGKLVPGENALKAAGGDRLTNPLFMAVDPARELAYVQDPEGTAIRTIDLKTGKIGGKFLGGCDPALDKDGNIYVLAGYGTNALLRFSPDGKPLPFSGTGSNKITVNYRAGHPNVGLYGLTVAPSGDIYVNQGVNPQNLTVFGPDGKVKNEALIKDIPLESASCLAVDRAGNIYAGMNFHDPKKSYPDGLGTEVPNLAWYMPYTLKSSWYNRPLHGIPEEPRWQRPYLNFYIFLGGSIFKFGPSGGQVWMGAMPPKTGDVPRPAGVPAEAVEYRTAYLGHAVWIKGATWRFSGFAPVATRAEGWGDPGCACWSNGRFALDGYGRLFVPDVLRYSIGVIDANANELARFGGYGNVDSVGAKGPIPSPEIPFAWPTGVCLAGDTAYVLDRINRRIAAVKLTCAAEAICDVR
ncbi:MAG TPA: SMP-30/gluconolactonase/LRE family protein [Planctomycetota bacterium]|nr:SMP-30/gluconolactonase/LRE family protein [Planctomycetota bacterium]